MRLRRVVRLLALVSGGTAAVVAALVLWLDRNPLPPALEHDGDGPPVALPERPPAAPAGEALVRGTSRLARRLAAGDALWELREELADAWGGPKRIALSLERLLPHLLEADAWEDRPKPRDPSTRIEAALRYLTKPRRDTDVLAVAGAVPDDRYGERMTLRLWTFDGAYPDGERERAQAVLERWLKLADTSGRGGFDVIVTPEMGRDVFPAQGGPAWAAGVYFVEDDYCVVRSRMRPVWRQRTVQHELAHALCHYLAKDFTKSRLVSEGIAEFLEHALPAEWRIDYGPERFQDELAALDRMLERWEAEGGEFAEETLQRLIALDPPHFYALRHFGYLAGLAAVGYAGGRRVEDALRARSDRPLREVLDTLPWKTFRRWVAEGGRLGRPQEAFVVEDGGPGLNGIPAGEWAPATERAREAWTRLRVGTDLRVEDLKARPERSPFDDEVVGKVIETLFTMRSASAIVSDLSEAMDEPLDLRPWSTEFPPLSYQRLRADTPREFVDRIKLLSSGRRTRVPVFPLADVDTEGAKLEDVRAHSGAAVPPWMRKGRASLSCVILCTAGGAYVDGGDVAYEWERLHGDEVASKALREFRKAYPGAPKVALVIDLGAQPTKYALHWTYVLAAASGFRNPVAYWNPRLPRR